MIKYQINNQPFISLDTHIDIDGLKSIEKHIILGLVKSKNNIGDGAAAKANFYPSDVQNKSKSLLDISWPEVVSNPAHPYYEQYKELNFDLMSCRMFNRYMFDTIQMGQMLTLRTYPPKQFHLKDSAEHCFDTPSLENFPELMHWIKNLAIFKEIGRIIFFLNSPYDKHAIHKDHFFGNKEQFILINLNLDKKDFFIMDEDGTKLIVNSNSVIFDPRNYHGTEGKTYYSWTLRIDGKFDIDWLKANNLFDHYYPQKPIN
jgi:hypothetical protein